MNNKRTAIAIKLFVLLMLGRAADNFATYYYSPDLAFEGNPVVLATGGQWWTIMALWVAAAIGGGILSFRLATRNYHSPFISEIIANKLFGKAIKKTAKQRYVDDFYFTLGLSFISFMLSIYWILIHGLRIDIANQLAAFKIATLPAYLFILIILGYGAAYFIGNKVAGRYYQD